MGAKERKRLKLLLIASGSGTDAMSIMRAWKRQDFKTDEYVVDIAGLISTEVGAGCLERAEEYCVPPLIVDHDTRKREYPSNYLSKFKADMLGAYGIFEPDFIFAVGCKRYIPVVPGIDVCNIHPTDKFDHGGYTMVGLEPHKHVLCGIRDQVRRRVMSTEDKFFTHPTVHYLPLSDVNDVSKEYDRGDILLRGQVEIPSVLIKRFCAGKIRLGRAAEQLQQIVLPYEWSMLPAAVNMAARNIILGNGEQIP